MASLDTRLHALEARVAALEQFLANTCPTGWKAYQHAQQAAQLLSCDACLVSEDCPGYEVHGISRRWCRARQQAAQSRESDKTPAGVEPAPQQPRSEVE